MKKFLITTVASGLLASAHAADINLTTFGRALAGWDAKQESCNYLLNDGTYRTLRPSATPTKSGGLFVSVVVEFDPRGGADATGWLEFTFNASGQLTSAQAKVRMVGEFADSGIIRPIEEVVGEGDSSTTKLQSADDVMIELFNRLDQKMVEVRKTIEDRRDNSVISRMKYGKFKRMNMSAALRHNANALLRSVK